MPPKSWRKRAVDADWVDEVAVARVVSGGPFTVDRALTYAEIMAVYDAMHARTDAGVKTVVARLRSHTVDPDINEDMVAGWVRRRGQERKTRCETKTIPDSAASARVA